MNQYNRSSLHVGVELRRCSEKEAVTETKQDENEVGRKCKFDRFVKVK